MKNVELTAHCSPEIAAWLDPGGQLREAGLMKADIVEDNQGSHLSFQHKRILARDERLLAALPGLGKGEEE